jgi:hypothetical protein
MTAGPVERMHQAESLLADPMFNEAFTAVEAAIVAKLKSGATDKDSEWLLSLRLMAKIKGWIVGQVQSGKVELHEEKLKEEQRKK